MRTKSRVMVFNEHDGSMIILSGAQPLSSKQAKEVSLWEGEQVWPEGVDYRQF